MEVVVSRMSGKRIALHVAIWLGVFAFWLSATRRYHPTPALAVLATAVLTSASAVAVYVNSLILMARIARRRLWWQYAASLLVTVTVLDLIAVPLIQIFYDWLWGPDPRRFGFWFNLLSDGIIIVVHIAAATVVWWLAKFLRKRAPPQSSEI
jgi:hypothetical protein